MLTPYEVQGVGGDAGDGGQRVADIERIHDFGIRRRDRQSRTLSRSWKEDDRFCRQYQMEASVITLYSAAQQPSLFPLDGLSKDGEEW